VFIPERLPSLVVLAGFWIPPAIAGYVAAKNPRKQLRTNATTYVAMVLFAAVYSTAWFYWNVKRMPPYIPGATMDPTFAAPEAVRALAIFTSALILPGSLVAFYLTYRLRGPSAENSLSSSRSAAS
jgi:hypothetical protein